MIGQGRTEVNKQIMTQTDHDRKEICA